MSTPRPPTATSPGVGSPSPGPRRCSVSRPCQAGRLRGRRRGRPISDHNTGRRDRTRHWRRTRNWPRRRRSAGEGWRRRGADGTFPRINWPLQQRRSTLAADARYASAATSPALPTYGGQAETQRQLGTISVLVSNAAITGPSAPFWDTDPEEYWRTPEVHLHGAFLCVRAVWGGMVARGRGLSA